MDFYGFERGRNELPGKRFGLFLTWSEFSAAVTEPSRRNEIILADLQQDEKDLQKKLEANIGKLNALVKPGKEFTGDKNDPAAVKAWADGLTDADAKDEPSKAQLAEKKNWINDDVAKLNEIKGAKTNPGTEASYVIASKYGKAPEPPKKEKKSGAGEPETRRDYKTPLSEMTLGDLKDELAPMIRSQSGGGDGHYRNEGSGKNPIIKGYETLGDIGNAHAYAASSWGGAGIATNFAGSAWGGLMGRPFSGSYYGPGVGVGITSGGPGFGGFGFSGAQGFAEVGGGGYGGGYGFGNDFYFDIAGFGTSSMISNGIEDDDRKLSALISFLIMKIMMGDIDSITTAMIVISRKAKETLRRAAVAMLSAMRQYDEKQDQMTKQFEKMQFDPENPYTFQRDSQALSMRINGIAMARQMSMNHLRDVIGMQEEISNVEKSVIDVTIQGRIGRSRWA